MGILKKIQVKLSVKYTHVCVCLMKTMIYEFFILNWNRRYTLMLPGLTSSTCKGLKFISKHQAWEDMQFQK